MYIIMCVQERFLKSNFSYFFLTTLVHLSPLFYLKIGHILFFENFDLLLREETLLPSLHEHDQGTGGLF